MKESEEEVDEVEEEDWEDKKMYRYLPDSIYFTD